MAKRKSSDKAPLTDADSTSEDSGVAETGKSEDSSTSQTPDVTTAAPPSEEDAHEADAEQVSDAEQGEPEADAGAETEAQTEPESSTNNPLTIVPPEPARHITLPLIFGGVVAALLGFIAARGEILDPLLPPSLRANGPDAALAEQLDAVSNRLKTLENTVATLPEPQAPTPVDLSPIASKLSALTDRVDTLASRPVVTTDVPQAALDAALADLRATASAQQDEIDRLLADARLIKDSAEAAANATLARAAVTRIQSAVDTGTPFAAALGDLQAAGATDIPDALRNSAENGVVPLAELQATIPDAARNALDAARAADGSGGVTSFLQRQLGVRSIEPQEGLHPDAVLSRIEAAVRTGRLGDALAEVETLPDPARDALRTWTEQAQSRLDAVTAANALAERLSAL